MAEDLDGTWTCPACTLVNNIRKRRCDACNSRKPTDVVSTESGGDEENAPSSLAFVPTRRRKKSQRARFSPRVESSTETKPDIPEDSTEIPSLSSSLESPSKTIVVASEDPSEDPLQRPPGIPSSLIFRHVIDGCRTEEASFTSSNLQPVINPATNKPCLYYQETSQEALNHAIQQACGIQESIYRSSLSNKGQNIEASWWPDPHNARRRAEVLTKIADLLQSNIDRLTDLEVTQIGRPRKEMRFQLSRLHEWFRYYAGILQSSEASCPPFGKDHVNLVRRVPLGVVAQITPFNHPLLIAVKKLAPALAAGNCVILKPSEKAPASVVELALLCRSAGLPAGVLSVVLGGKNLGASLVSDSRIRKVDFTGGPTAGQAIGDLAGKNIGKMTQELGGKAPMIVFGPNELVKTMQNNPKRKRELSSEQQSYLDAYLDPIVNGCAFGAFIASGQTCIAGTRLLVQKEIYQRMCEKLTEKVKTAILEKGMGDPFDMTTTFGPMIHKEQMEFVDSIVTSCVGNHGTRLELLCGGQRYSGFEGNDAHLNKGNWYEPTLIAYQLETNGSIDCHRRIVSDLHHDSPLFQKELFGPVLGILPFEDEDHAIELANDSPFSLGCSIWTRDMSQAHSVAEKVRAGIVWVNDHHKNAPSSPWGGLTKDSGVGVENGPEALMNYSQSKSLVIRTTPYNDDWFQDPNARYN